VDRWSGENLRKLGIQIWWMVARDRQSWKNRKPGLTVGCSTADEDCGIWDGKTKATTFQKGHSAFGEEG
jgi:hypothetical protein